MDKHFKAYNNILYRIDEKNMELIQLKEKWYGVSGVRYDDIKVQGGKPVDIADQYHNIVEKEKMLKSIIDYKEELRRIHENEIEKVENPKYRTVLKLFYLDKCTIKQIAYRLKASDGHVKTMKRKAVQEFKEKNKGG